MSSGADEFLSFWQERLSRECVVDPENMRFVDQRWIDFVPGLWPAHILRDPSYNVAYWNLDHRVLAFEGGRYFVNGIPLHFFHFSGYSPDVPYLLSKHQGYLGNSPRILLSEHPVVALLCDEYGGELLSDGYREDGKKLYAFGRLANGLELDRSMRRLYRDALLSAERTATELPPNPLQPDNVEGFLHWLTEPSEISSSGRLSRYLKAVHARRIDLQKAFPDPEGINFEAFASWARHEVAEGRLDPRLAKLPLPEAGKRLRSRLAFQLTRVERRLSAVPVPGTGNEHVRLNLAGSVRRLERMVDAVPAPTSLDRPKLNAMRALGRLEGRLTAVPLPGTSNELVRLNMSRWLGRLERKLTVTTALPLPSNQEPAGVYLAEELLSGIRVANYLRTESGVGELGRLALATARAAGIATSTYLETTALSRQSHDFAPSGPDRNVNLECVNADELPNFARRAGDGFFQGHYTIGLWAWEIEEFPRKFLTAFDHVDEVWALSTFARESIARVSTKPVCAFPLPIMEPRPDPGVGRAELGIPDGFTFLFCFDLLSIFERKNPLGLVEAFCKAFQAGEGPLLVVKVINGQLEPMSLERLKLAAALRPAITVIDTYLDAGANAALMAACDCYVSLHRSEGFGLSLAEAMALGKPVIATGYSGNLDFMTPTTSYLVPWVPGHVPPGCSPYPVGARWAEPDLDAAARLMREVYENPQRAAEVGQRARENVLANHGLQARAPHVRERFEAAQSQLRQRELVKAEDATVSVHRPVGSLVDVARRPRDLNVPSRHPRSARLFRRVLWRVLRSHDDHDRRVHLGLTAGVDGIAAQVSQLRNAIGSAEAEHARSVTSLRGEISAQHDVIEEQGARLDLQGSRLDDQSVRLGDHESWLRDHESRVRQVEQPERWARLDQAVAASEELRAIPFMSNPALLTTTDDKGRPAIGYRQGALRAGGYVSFEDLFRGAEEKIRDRFEPYLDVLAGHAPVVDVGCGRGELLDLLAGAGVAATGVDLDPSMVQRARAKGHEVVERGALEYLGLLPDGSVGALFSAQVIEHFSPEELAGLLREAHRVLRPGGALVLETVNPYSLQAFKAFWTDITHRHPIYPEALVVHCAEAGFYEAVVMFPNGTGDLEKDRWSEGEYAVVARNQGEQ